MNNLYLKEDGLSLRAVEPEDALMMWEIETDSSQWKLTGMSAPYSRKNLMDYAACYDADPFHAGELRLVIEFNSTAIGLMDLYEINAINRTAFVGVYINECMRNRGLGIKSLLLIEKYARDLLNIRILGAKICEQNKPSKHLFESAGYCKCGKLENWLLRGPDSMALLIYTKYLIK